MGFVVEKRPECSRTVPFTVHQMQKKFTYVRINEGNEKAILYVEGETAKYFGGEYIVLQDTKTMLIMMRHYPPSGLTEVVSIDKGTGRGFDTKTIVSSYHNAPATDTYVMSYRQLGLPSREELEALFE